MVLMWWMRRRRRLREEQQEIANANAEAKRASDDEATSTSDQVEDTASEFPSAN